MTTALTHPAQARIRRRVRELEHDAQGSNTPLRLVRVKDVLFVFVGGFGQLTRQELGRFARPLGLDFATLAVESNLKDLADAPEETRLALHTSTLAEAQAYPLLRQQYLERVGSFLLSRAPGTGGGGRPEATALDINLSLADLLPRFRQLLREVAVPPPTTVPQGWRALPVPDQHANLPTPVRVIFVGGACGSVGAAGLLLLPMLMRHVARELGITHLQILAVVAGPHIYRNLTRFTADNYVATMHQIELLTRHGMHHSFVGGLTIDDPTPPLDRAILVDAEPQGDEATEEELAQLARDTARTLLLATTGGVFNSLDGLVADERLTPWTTMQAVYPFLSLDALTPLLTATTARTRLTALLAGAA